MIHYENQILRPAVIAALSTQPDVLVHIAPIEVLSQSGHKRSAAELGAGTPDLLLSMRWQAAGIFGAQWIGLELKRPALPAGVSCRACCAPCEVFCGRSVCCKAKVLILDVPQSAGVLSPDQKREHLVWSDAGRWVWVIHSPAEALERLADARCVLYEAGLMPAPMGG